MNEKLYTKASIEITDKTMLAVASTAVEDRQGESITQAGWDIKNFKKNPVLQWAHDHRIPAIGRAKNIKIEGEGKRAKLVFEPEFHDITPEAKALKQLVEDGYINSFSVGFRPLEMDGNTYTSQELLEISLVNVPANPEARMLAYKSLKDSGVTDDVAKRIGAFVEADNSHQDLKDLKEQLSDLQEQVTDLVKGLKHLNPAGRKSEVVTQRLALNKVVVRAADILLEQKPAPSQANLVKVIKRASEKLIVDQKQELKNNGTN